MRWEPRKCDYCNNLFQPKREAQAYCKPRCRRDASYTRERLLKEGPKSFRKKRLATPLPGSFRNGTFSSSKTVASGAPQTPDIGSFAREQLVARAHLENPITVFLPDGSQGRVWLATSKDGSKVIGDELHWRVNIQAAIKADETVMTFTEEPIAVTNFNPHGPTLGALQGDGYQLTYDAFGYPELPSCLDRRPKPSLAKAA